MIKPLLRRVTAPPTLKRILTETAVLLALHLVLMQVLARIHLLEHLLSPGPGSKVAIAVTTMFLLLRIFVIAILPGWFAARLWLFLTRERAPVWGN
jgi:hypothetical protein